MCIRDRFRDVPASRPAGTRPLVQGQAGRNRLPARGRLAADLGICRQALPAAVPFRPNASLADAGAQYRSSDQPSGCGTRTSIRLSTEREGVGDPAPASSFYRDRLFEWFKKHPAAGQDARAASERFERFVCAQQFWDRAMAEAIAGARRDTRHPLVVGIMGSGHIEYRDGVPHQLAALGVDDVATALPWPANTDYPIHDPPIADVLFGVAPPP